MGARQPGGLAPQMVAAIFRIVADLGDRGLTILLAEQNVAKNWGRSGIPVPLAITIHCLSDLRGLRVATTVPPFVGWRERGESPDGLCMPPGLGHY